MPYQSIHKERKEDSMSGILCSQCNGSGEGYSEDSSCKSCAGSGEQRHPYEIEEEDLEDD
jgi:DnaJ-class molecular chaperone